MEITSLSKSSIYRREKTGDFPKRLSLGGNCVVWKSIEIDRWIKDLAPVGG
jgi:prophage regulatory protein